MMLLARAITQKFSTPTNNHLRTSSNTRNQAVIHDGIVDIQTKNAGFGGNDNRNAGRQNMNQAFNAGSGSTQNNDTNDYDVKEPKDDAKAVSEVIASNKMITNSIIFDDPYVENNGGSDDHDLNAHDPYHDVKILAYNALREAENKKQLKQETFVDQTYFSIPSTSNISSESKEVKAEPQIPKMPKESKFLNMFDKMDLAINALQDIIDVTLLEDRKRRWMSDSQNSLREFYKTDVILMYVCLSKTLKELKQELMEEVQDMLNIFESMKHKVEEKSPKSNILQNEIDRLLEVSLTSEIRDCLLLSVAKQKNELLENEIVKILDESKDIQANLLKRIKILENYFKQSQSQSIDFELNYNIKKRKWLVMSFGSQGKLLCVTPFPTNIAVQAKKVLKSKDNTNRSKPVTSHSTPKRVGSSNSVRRPKSKDTKSKNRVFKNTNAKSSSAYVRKMPSSVMIDSNKRETMNLNEYQSNTSVLNTKTVNVVNDGSNLVCVSYGKDVFLLSHEKCVARYVLSKDSRVKRALFTTQKSANSGSLGVPSVVAKSRFSVAKTPTATNKVIQLVLWIVDSGCSKHMTGNLQLLRNFIEKFMGTIYFGNGHFTTITGYGAYV
ncbi:hypothetical protein Tco_1516173 [Tanacetum coccineum]